MARMKTFFLYFLGLVGFMALSIVLEFGLIENMYVKMAGEITSPSNEIFIEDVSAKASNVNGYMDFKLATNSPNANNKFVKIELFSKMGLPSGTKYVPITDLEPGTPKNYQVKFKANEIRHYKLSIVTETPDKSNILNIFGWEIDLTNVFGMDLSNVTLFGVKLSELFTIENLKVAGGTAYLWIMRIVNSVPWWGYAIAAGVVIWHLPKRYLFGIFP